MEVDERSALRWLEENRPTLASAITSLPWVADGIEGIERQALRALVDIETLYGAEADPALVNKDWLADGVDQREVLVLMWLYDFVSYGEAEAGKLVRMPFLDSLEEVATDTLEALDGLGKPVNWRWLYRAVLAESWVEDGLDQSEIEFVHILQGLGREALVTPLLEKAWIADGFDDLGVSVMVQLRTLATYDEVSAESIVRMPFLDTLETIDVDTLGALDDLGRPAQRRWLFRAVVGEPWVEDGLDESETVFVQRLELLANSGEALAPAVMAKPWIEDGLDEAEARVLELLAWIARGGEDIALRIVAAPFLRTIEPVDSAAIETLRALGVSSQDTLRAVVEKPWIEDGLDELETAFVQKLTRLANGNEATARAIMENLDAVDTEAVDVLVGFASQHRDLFLAVVERPWVGDGLDEVETELLKHLRWTALGGDDIALSLATFMQAVQPDSLEAVKGLWGLGYYSQDTLRALLKEPWVEDGLGEDEDRFVRALAWLAGNAEAAALQIVERPWFEDGVHGQETAFVWALAWLARDSEETALQAVEMLSQQESPRAADVVMARAFRGLVAHPDLFRAVMATPWFEDGLNESEAAATQNLARIADGDDLAAPLVLAMPFLQTVEPADAAATQALGHMAVYRPENFQRVMAHPTLSGGISDEWAKVVTVLGAVSDSDPDRIDVLLDPEQRRVEERVIDLPLAGAVTLAIIRTEEGAPRSMDLLEHAVRSAEAFMGVPLPTSRVTLHFDETYRLRGAAGVNFATHIGMLSRFDVDDDSTNAGHTGAITVHEVAHYYWRGGSPWVVEGGANMVAAISEHARTGQPVDAGGLSCTHAGNIAELEAQGKRGVFGCNYAFGHRLLLDLYRTLGEDAFRQGFRDLYLRSRIERLGISHYKTAFTAVAPDRAADIERITVRWYEGAEAPNVLDPDPSPVDPILPSVSGRVIDAYVVAGDGNRRTNFSTRYTHHMWLRLLFTLRAQPEPRELRFTIEGYYEDGFAFWLRDVTVPVPAHRASGDFQVWRGASSTYQWAPGQYIIYIYHEGQKVAEVQFRFLEIS